MDQVYNFFLLLGGIGLFLFGINYMTASLSIAAGENLRKWLSKLTAKPYKAVVIGALVTAAIQSSGAVMVMTVGFVNAQMMNLYQALYVMLGAAIGTTITAQIIAFDIAPIAPFILFVGMVMYLFIKKRIIKRIGAIILGFGMLFVGIYLMGEAVDAMQLGHLVESFLKNVENPILQFLFGFVFTFIIQSSSASVGILQVIVASSAGIAFDLHEVVYMILGMNVGALAPLILSSIGGNRASKRATVTQIASRLFAVIIFIIIVVIVPQSLIWIENLSPSDPSRQIANLHLIFNIIGAIALFPFIKPMGDLSMKLMPDDASNEYESRKLIYITPNASKTPSLLLEQAKKEILRFGTINIKNLKMATKAFFERDDEVLDEIFEREATLSYLNHELNEVISKLYSGRLNSKSAERIAGLYNVVADFERIGDHAENIAEYERDIRDLGVHISDRGMADLRRISDKVIEMLEVTVQAFVNEDKALYEKAQALEDQIDDLQDELIENHIERMKQGICEPRGGIIYTDIVSDLERCGDHAMNIAEYILGSDAPIENHQA